MELLIVRNLNTDLYVLTRVVNRLCNLVFIKWTRTMDPSHSPSSSPLDLVFSAWNFILLLQLLIVNFLVYAAREELLLLSFYNFVYRRKIFRTCLTLLIGNMMWKNFLEIARNKTSSCLSMTPLHNFVS